MTEITIKCGFGVSIGLDFRDDFVKKGSYLLFGGHTGEIKELHTGQKEHIASLIRAIKF